MLQRLLAWLVSENISCLLLIIDEHVIQCFWIREEDIHSLPDRITSYLNPRVGVICRSDRGIAQYPQFLVRILWVY